MTPEQKFAMIRNVLKYEETRLNAHIKVEQDHVIALRQLLDQALAIQVAEDVRTAEPST